MLPYAFYVKIQCAVQDTHAIMYDNVSYFRPGLPKKEACRATYEGHIYTIF